MAHALREPDHLRRIDAALPAHAYFLVSAIFHYLGPAFAVLLFAQVDILGVAWLRIATAAAIFAVWRRPWRLLTRTPRPDLRLICSLGLVLGAMNAVFYLALDRLPLGTVGAIEFLGPIALAASAARSGRNIAALGLAVAGVGLLADVRLAGEPLGFVLAGINAALFVLYVVLGHRAARSGIGGIDCLAAAMLVAGVAVSPVGFSAAMPAFARPELLLAGIGVGICSSVIPYVSDQLAMARLSRGTFAFLLALLPAFATVIGVVVLRQIPSLPELAGVGLIVAGVALRRERDEESGPAGGVAAHRPPRALVEEVGRVPCRPGLTARAQKNSLSEARVRDPVSLGEAVPFSPGREPRAAGDAPLPVPAKVFDDCFSPRVPAVRIARRETPPPPSSR